MQEPEKSYIREWVQPAILLAIVALLVAIWQDINASRIAAVEKQEDVEESRAQEKRAIAPFLSVVTPYHETKVTTHKNVGRHYEMGTAVLDRSIGLRTDLSRFHQSNRDALCSFGVVENSGGGPALDVEVEWIVECRTSLNDKFEAWLEKENATFDAPGRLHNTSALRPMQLPAGGSGSIAILPAALELDEHYDALMVFGEVELRCKDLSGNPHMFRQEFMAHAYYDPVKPGYKKTGDVWADTPGIVFRYRGVKDRDGPYPFRSGEPLMYGDATDQSRTTEFHDSVNPKTGEIEQIEVEVAPMPGASK
jgi:hypothetical protein